MKSSLSKIMLPDPGNFYPLFHSRRLEVAKQMIATSGTSAIDVGCGQGFLKSLGFTKAMGIDIRKTPGVVARASAEKFPFRDATFDLVVVGEVLEHLDHPALGIDEWVRVLCARRKARNLHSERNPRS